MSYRIKVNIWNRDFELDCDYQNYPGESVTVNQEKAVKLIPNVDFSKAKALVEQYIYKNNQTEVKEMEISNIFRYVMPKSFVIPREDNVVFALFCDYRFDMEHGIAIVFEGEDCKEVGPEDIVL